MELRPRDARPDSGPIDEAHERVRQALYDYLVSLDASVVRSTSSAPQLLLSGARWTIP